MQICVGIQIAVGGHVRQDRVLNRVVSIVITRSTELVLNFGRHAGQSTITHK